MKKFIPQLWISSKIKSSLSVEIFKAPKDCAFFLFAVLGKVKMEEFSETNPIPRSANRKKAESMGALKISTESDDFIFDEIHRRDRLEDEEFEDEMEEEDEGELEDE